MVAAGVPSGGQSHVPVLDGVRGLAILLVLVVHFGGSAADRALATGNLIERVYARVVDTSGCGVDLFFVLSGFLITRILLDARGADHPLRAFYIRRVLRIFPLYYLALFIVLIVLPPLVGTSPGVEDILSHQSWLWAYGGNIACGVFGVQWNQDWMRLDHFWSLSVEEHFYFVWPALALYLAPRTLARACGCFVVGAIVVRLAVLHAGMVDASYQLTPCRLDALSLGALVAIVAFERGTVAPLVRIARYCVVGGLAAVIALAVVSARKEPSLWWTTGTVHTVFAIFFAGLLVLTLASPAEGWLARAFSHRALRALGKYSYGLYVWHEILRPWFHQWFPLEELETAVGSRLIGVLGYALVCIAASMVVAYVSWHAFEKHFLRLKARAPYRTRDRTTADRLVG